MNFPGCRHPHNSTLPTSPPHLNLDLHHHFATLRSRCSGLLHHVSASLHHHTQNLLNPGFCSLTAHLESALSDITNHGRHAVVTGFGCRFHAEAPIWARIAETSEKAYRPVGRAASSSPTQQLEERLAGVPVYALSNSTEEFVLVSDTRSGRSVGLFCFREEDADELLEQMKSMDPAMRQGSRVVPVALNKVFQLNVTGVAFRLIPEVSQVRNALKEKEKNGDSDKSVLGVPVFKSQSLILRSQKKAYHPVFFRKEDLEDSLLRASRQQGRLNPAFRQGDIQVAALEEIVEGIKQKSSSEWNDVVFIPPGFDVATDPAHSP